MPGFDKSRFVGVTAKDLDEFTCAICQDVFVDPVFTQCCRQTFCKSCIRQWLNQNNVCPNDRKTLTVKDLSSPPRFVINLLNNMKVNCDYHSKGCKIISTIEELPKHIPFCYENPNRLCKTCNLKIIGAEEHNCVSKLMSLNSSISNEIEKLKNENKILINKYQEQNIEFENLMILNSSISNENVKLQKQVNEIKSSNAYQIDHNQILIQENRDLKTKIEQLSSKLDERNNSTKNIEPAPGISSAVGKINWQALNPWRAHKLETSDLRRRPTAVSFRHLAGAQQLDRSQKLTSTMKQIEPTIQLAREYLNDVKIDAIIGMTTKEQKICIEISKESINCSDNYEGIVSFLFAYFRRNDLSRNWKARAFQYNDRDNNFEGIIESDKEYIRLRFRRLIIELFTTK